MWMLSLVAPLVLFRRAGYELASGFTFSPPFIIIPHNTITLHKQLYLQSPKPQLSPVHYTDTHPTRNVVCPSGARFENRPHLTPSSHLVWSPKHVIVQWVGIGTHTHIHRMLDWKKWSYCLACQIPRFNSHGLLFLWSYVKDKVYRTHVTDLDDLKARINAAVAAVDTDRLCYGGYGQSWNFA